MGSDERIGPHAADHAASPSEVRSSGRDEDTAGARWNDDGGYEPNGTDTNADSGPTDEAAPAPPTSPASPAAPASRVPGGLSLRGVLDSALPHELGTDKEPSHYTVAAVFSRQVTPEERVLIEGPEARARLTDHGYPDVELKVADRRLEITRTNLAMLADGLASQIADLLRDVEQQVVAARERRDDERARWTAVEAARAARVKAEADRVRFE